MVQKDIVLNHQEEFDLFVNLSVCFFGMIRFLIFDPRPHRSWHIKGTDKSTLNKDLSVSLMCHDPSLNIPRSLEISFRVFRLNLLVGCPCSKI